MLKFGSKSDINVSYKCTVRLLEDTEVIECEFQAHHKGKFLVEYVCRELNLVERDYFGLRYVDSSKQRHWLDPAKTVLKQVKEMDPILFSFRVKFYPPDPFRLKEEITRYQVYLQLKRDLLHGRLYCTHNEASQLGAYIIQSELGDFDPEEHMEGYISEHKLLLKQTPKIEEKIAELHQTQLKGQPPSAMETAFLKKAYTLDTYGVDPHPVKDHKGNQLYLGINHCGILTFQGSRKTHHFRWNEVQKINYEGKMFIIHLTFNEDPRTKKKHTVGFKCPTGAACRHVWRCAVEQMLFFTLPSSSEAPSVVTGGGFFQWGTKFRYSGRVEKEILEDVGPLRREEPTINRSSYRPSSLRRKASSVPATPSTPVGSEIGEIRYGSLPRSNHSASVPDPHLDGGGRALDPLLSPLYCPDGNLPLLETVAEDQEVSGRPRVPEEMDSVDTNQSRTLSEHVTAALVETQVTPVECNEGTAELQVIANGQVHDPVDSPKVSASTVEGGKDDSIPGFESSSGSPGTYNDYYFRDSFDRSSSESQLDLGPHQQSSTGHGRHLDNAPVPFGALRASGMNSAGPGVGGGGMHGLVDGGAASGGGGRAGLRALMSSRHGMRPFVRVLVSSCVVVAVSLLAVAVVVFESNSVALGTLRKMPEMVVLRRDFYEPAKEFLRQSLQRFL
ncbi:FERM domain-containing protein 5 isoform X2 [Ischnura elegans]|uniref:FERM domain-containing protein 5 isoform X2 n=1 Tax=Ischnura elegans TaxID=197161 RepID=UPI001ED87C83|nr:FERM domain-containing protein 5 isoform X2 [Ischnura elegans]